jgi:multidrug efflux system membrane fusion protein
MEHRASSCPSPDYIMSQSKIPDSLQALPTGDNTRGVVHPRLRLGLGIAAAAAALGLIWYATLPASSGQHQPPPPPVNVAEAVRKNVTVVERTIGTVVAQATVNVTSQVAGQVTKADFQEGQIVHKDDVLFELDPRPFDAAVAQAEANLARDEAQLAAAARDRKRYQALFDENAISAQQRDQASANAGALAGSVKADKAALDIAKLNLGYASIRAPVDGKTGPILIQPGNLVKADDTNALVVVTQIEPIKVSFFLPQTDLPRIQAQMQAHKLAARVTAHGDSTALTAPVDFVGNAVNGETGTIELRATFPNKDARLVPGELVDVTVALAGIPGAIVVPDEAVNQGPDGDYLYAIDKDDRAHIVPVTVEYDDGNASAVKGKIAPGTRVVTVGQMRVEPGKSVTILKSRANARGGGA